MDENLIFEETASLAAEEGLDINEWAAYLRWTPEYLRASIIEQYKDLAKFDSSEGRPDGEWTWERQEDGSEKLVWREPDGTIWEMRDRCRALFWAAHTYAKGGGKP